MKKQLFFLIASAMMLLSACGDDDKKDEPQPQQQIPAATCDAKACRTATGANYKGNVCVDNACGGNAKTDCTGDNMVCDNHVCKKNNTVAACDVNTCKTTTGNGYRGNACVSKSDGTKTCGCNANVAADCNDGYSCKSGVCVSDCEDTKCANAEAAEYVGNVCIDGSDGKKTCGCKKDAPNDCKAGYTCDEHGVCQKIPCDADSCKNANTADYKGNACIAGSGGIEDCGCKAGVAADCNEGYSCKSGRCVLECDETECENAPAASYVGSVCIDGSNGKKICGCKADAPNDCKSGYTCDAHGVCQKDSCNAETCKNAATADYKGNVCVVGTGGVEDCGCNAGVATDCKLGYSCVSGTCKKDACVESKCEALTGDEYKGNACIEDDHGVKDCGCREGVAEDCKSGYSCSTGICLEEYVCTVDDCKSRTTHYLGDACVTKDENTFCGCNGQSDCSKDNYTCNTTTNECEYNDPQGECTPAQCAAEEHYYLGNICIPDSEGAHCGCEKDTDCNGYLYCKKDSKYCGTEDGCRRDPSICANRDENDYLGNICKFDPEDPDDEGTCGCNTVADCRVGANSECMENGPYKMCR